MKALIKTNQSLAVTSVEVPRLDDYEVLVAVKCAGLCRTDVAVARDIIHTQSPLILGHEFSGVVHQVGDLVTQFSVGTPVAVKPSVACGNCGPCQLGQDDFCLQPQFLGVNRQGCFAEFVKVPAKNLLPIPSDMSFQRAAYLEPLAAAMAVLELGFVSSDRGLIYGDNRIAKLTLRVCHVFGLTHVDLLRPEDPVPEDDSYDFAVETQASSAVLHLLAQALKPGGQLVLKSRGQNMVTLKAGYWVTKQLSLRAVRYGCFRKALQALEEDRVPLEDLFGPSYPLEDFETVFQQADDESRKLFFVME